MKLVAETFKVRAAVKEADLCDGCSVWRRRFPFDNQDPGISASTQSSTAAASSYVRYNLSPVTVSCSFTVF